MYSMERGNESPHKALMAYMLASEAYILLGAAFGALLGTAEEFTGASYGDEFDWYHVGNVALIGAGTAVIFVIARVISLVSKRRGRTFAETIIDEQKLAQERREISRG